MLREIPSNCGKHHPHHSVKTHCLYISLYSSGEEDFMASNQLVERTSSSRKKVKKHVDYHIYIWTRAKNINRSEQFMCKMH
ncbi:hypothetical protein Hanom_Chr09g00788431 [Helianthus anomalus]